MLEGIDVSQRECAAECADNSLGSQVSGLYLLQRLSAALKSVTLVCGKLRFEKLKHLFAAEPIDAAPHWSRRGATVATALLHPASPGGGRSSRDDHRSQ